MSQLANQTELVGRVLSLIDQHRSETLLLTDVSRTVGVSPRTLRSAFHNVCGISPKQFLIRRQLIAIHDALVLSEKQPGAVARVAMAHGISELGRFARVYRQFYGELPSQTLQRGCSASATGRT